MGKKFWVQLKSLPKLVSSPFLFYVDLIEEVPEVVTTNPLTERLKQGAGKTSLIPCQKPLPDNLKLGQYQNYETDPDFLIIFKCAL